MSRVPAKLWVALISTFAAGVLVASIEYAIPASATSRSPVALTSTSASDWPAYLDGTLHSSYNSAETSFTTRNAGTVSMGWHFSQGDGYLSSPVVADGSVYIGANNGWLYQLAAPSGKLLHKIFLGEVSITSCPPPPTGMVSTATVATDPRNRQLTVYASGANGYLYALNASTLKVEWRSIIAIPSKTVNNYFDWSSPTVANGRIYVGISSNCDSPLVRAGISMYDQATGKKLQEFFTVPKGWVGGSVWSSVAVGSNGDVYATTGNGPETTGATQLVGESESIVKLNSSLRFLARYQISSSDEGFDTDFGASPVLFNGLVGACNKNGIFYALRQSTMRLTWKRTVSGPAGGNEECIATPVWNGKDLFFGTPAVAYGNGTYEGSVQERSPTGALKWITQLPNAIDGSPTLDGSGVIAVGTFDSTSTPNATYLVDAATGTVLRNLITGADFAQSVFADDMLISANQDGVYGWRA
jgi:outer membrane protein assembly factor BamB